MVDAVSLIKFFHYPPIELCFNREDKKNFLLVGAITLDQIWKIRNLRMHEAKVVDVDRALQDIHMRSREFWYVQKIPSFAVCTAIEGVWKKPRQGCLKVNCDAVVGPVFSNVAVVARYWRGTVVLATSKKVNTTIPLQVEAEAILWATQLAKDLEVAEVWFESDSKLCMDAILRTSSISWRAHGIINSIKPFFVNHPSWLGSWVSHKANGAPHALAGWSF